MWYPSTTNSSGWRGACSSEVPATTTAQRPPRILFLGDSTMIRLWSNLIAYPRDCPLRGAREAYVPADAQTNRSNSWLDYLRLEQPAPISRLQDELPTTLEVHWGASSKPGANISNPMGSGIAANRRVCCSERRGGQCSKQWLDVEMVPLPSCRDVVRHSALTRHRGDRTYDYIIVNCGLWDTVSSPTNATAAKASRDAQTYLQRLAPLTRNLIWITTSATLNDAKYSQKTNQIAANNVAMLHMLSSAHWSETKTGVRMHVLDAFKFSCRNDMHQDNVHMKVGYYDRLQRILAHYIQMDFISCNAVAADDPLCKPLEL